VAREVARELAPVRAALEHGPGFAVVSGLEVACDTPAMARTLYWWLAHGLGRPVPQNVQGTLLYDVLDTGRTVAEGARFSVTNAESGFHTDNSFGAGVVDYVGLLCLRVAREGGRSQVVSGLSAVNRLAQLDPGATRTLAEPFLVDRRGGVPDGEDPTVAVPVLYWQGGDLLVRYLRYWIEAGHARSGSPLSAAQRRALDAWDRILGDPALRCEFDLAPGEVFLINNRWILHNRTAFVDHTAPGRRRHLIRLWIERTDR
jgi:alpha-ketoglutarate-dependent taurine dioxygenase